jgi:hypothetical protein
MLNQQKGELTMAVEIVIVNVDKTETSYASVDAMPEGPLKEEIKKVLAKPSSAHLTKLRKLLQA